jgi:hypothetical protein
MSSSDIVIHASGYSVKRKQSGRRTINDTNAASDVSIFEGLEGAGFQIVDTIDIVEVESKGRRDGDSERSLRIDVPIETDNAAILLVEDDTGLLIWKFPEKLAEGERRRALDSGFDSFSFNSSDDQPIEGRRVFGADWLAAVVLRPVRVHVLRFLATRTIEAAIAHIEGNMPQGPVIVTNESPLSWQIASHSEVAKMIPKDRPAKILLLVHGTFSSTVGSFGALAGSETLIGASATYDLILGFDHHTLADDPKKNASDILIFLSALELPAMSVIDVIAYSRGGLVFRALAEELFPFLRNLQNTSLKFSDNWQATPPLSGLLSFNFGKAIFVGCTNAGTLLAEPDNWKILLDFYTNILVLGARAGALATGTIAALPAISTTIRTLGAFAQMLSQVAISERKVPGLAAMEPDSALVKSLNGGSKAEKFLTRYFVIQTDFNPNSIAPTSPALMALVALNRLADRLYGTANDLVVHTESMANFGIGRTAAATVVIDDNLGVYHTVYFSNKIAQAAIGDWLEIQEGASSSPDVINYPIFPPTGLDQILSSPTQPRMPDVAGGSIFGSGLGGVSEQRLGSIYRPDGSSEHPQSAKPGRRGNAGIDWNYENERVSTGYKPKQKIRKADASIDWGGSEKPPSPPRLPEVSAPPPDNFKSPELTERYIAAEMDQFPFFEKDVPVFVTITPDSIVVSDHAAASSTSSAVELSRKKPLTVAVFPKLNCKIVGQFEKQVDLHVDKEVICRFVIRGLAAGSAELIVEARQGSSTVAFFVLKPVFVGSDKASLQLIQPLNPMANVQKQAVLRIYEFTASDGGVTLQFNLTSDDPEFADLKDIAIDRSFSLKSYAVDVIKQVENAWNLRQNGSQSEIYDSFLERLISDAKVRTNALIPESIRRALWRHRAAIDSIQVISAEPYIAWELMYLSDPDGQDNTHEGFLAEWGLTRWLHDAPIRRRHREIGSSNAYYIIPEYEDPRAALSGTVTERDMLVSMFPGIQSIDPTSRSVRKFLREGAKDAALVHFACHGKTQQNTVVSSELLMMSQKSPEGKSVPDTLTWQDVSSHADFGSGGGPLVFVNACQAGQSGGGIAGAAGFASAFLSPMSRRGAAAFIGALWSVDDKLANDFARAVYEGMARGDTLGKSVRAAREICKTRNDFTWLAYSVYGNT